MDRKQVAISFLGGSGMSITMSFKSLVERLKYQNRYSAQASLVYSPLAAHGFDVRGYLEDVK